jgi:hypothetical protein
MWSAFPTADYYGPSVPSRGHQPAVGLPTVAPARQRGGQPETVPTFTSNPVGGIDAQLCPCSLATGTPQTFPVASPPAMQSGFEVTTPGRPAVMCTAARPLFTRFEPVPRLRGFNHWFTNVAPVRLACRTRTVWQYRPVPALSGPLPTLPRTPGVRLPSASPIRCDGPAVGPCTPPGFEAPRGARHSRDTGPGRACQMVCVREVHVSLE